MSESHVVYPEGPLCQPNCPGPHSMYHDGYADGYEAGERARQAEPVGLLRAALAVLWRLPLDEVDDLARQMVEADGRTVTPWLAGEVARQVLASLPAQAVEPDDIRLRRLPNPPYDEAAAQPVEPGPHYDMAGADPLVTGAGHGSHRPGSVCLECERAAQAVEPGPLDVERLARALFLFRTSTNIPLPDDFWERQSAAMQAPFLAEARAVLARLSPDKQPKGAG